MGEDPAAGLTERLQAQVRMGEYNQLKGQLTAIARKAGGSLAVRDLGGILKPGDLVDTENLTTLFVVVQAHTKGEWLKNYETLSDFVVRAGVGCCRAVGRCALLGLIA